MMNHWLRGWLAGGPRWSWGGCDWCWVLLQDARQSVVCPVHGWAVGRLIFCLDESFLVVCVASYSFPNEWISLVRVVSFNSGRLLSSLLCHWLVGRVGRRGPLDVVCLLGAVFFVCGSKHGKREWESGLLWWLTCCLLYWIVDLYMERGRRAVRWNRIE